MNTFVNKVRMGVTHTANGALTYESTGNAVLDFFSRAGSARNMAETQLIALFDKAMKVDPVLTTKALFWLRDVRGGAGERQAFRTLLSHCEKNYPHIVISNITNVPEYGRWDDLLVLTGGCKRHAMAHIAGSLRNENPLRALVAKWMPRKGAFAAQLRNWMNMTPKQYRKMLVSLTKVVEQNMCAKNWEEINFEHVPSVAANRYQQAFARNAESYKVYRERLAKGEVKINAAALFPHDLTRHLKRPSDREDILSAQWKALPNFMADSQERILPMIDVSGSMSCPVGGNRNLNCMDVSVGLGAYMALKQPGDFNGMYLTFSSEPELAKADSTNGVGEMIRSIYQASWGGSTDLDAAMERILDFAVAHRVPQNEMPTMLIVLSDMQFNPHGGDGYFSNRTASSMVKDRFAEVGYNVPKIVWWNLNAEYGDSQTDALGENMMAVSGFSPAILKAIVNQEELPEVPTPMDLMLAVLNSPRYERVQA